MDVTCRILADDEHRAAHELGRVAFGGPRLAPDAPLPSRPGRILWGAFAGGRLVAVAGDRVQSQWYGGRLVPASGVSSVAVAPGERGRGYAQTLVAAVLTGARERGAAVSTLFATAPALYRRMGWEEAGVLTWWDLLTSALAGLRVPDGVTTRPATPEDREAIATVYAEVAAGSNGYLAHDDRRFPGWPFAEDYGLDGVTLAVGPAERVTGFATWERGLGYGAEARLTVPALVGVDAAATTALLVALGTWGAVTPTLQLLLPRPDPAWWIIPTGSATVRSVWPWMTRVIDAPAAVEGRGWPSYLDVEVGLELTDRLCPWNSGRWTLGISDGRGQLRPGGEPDVRLDACALGVWFAGGVTFEQLGRAGLAHVGGRAPASLSVGPAPATLDYF